MRIWLWDGVNIRIGGERDIKTWEYQGREFTLERLSPFIVQLVCGKHKRWVGRVHNSSKIRYGYCQFRTTFCRRGVCAGHSDKFEGALRHAADSIIDDMKEKDPPPDTAAHISTFLNELSTKEKTT